MSDILILRSIIVYSKKLSCSHCGRSCFSNHRFEGGAAAPESVEQVLQSDFKEHIPNIPEGWAMYGRLDIRCPEHK